MLKASVAQAHSDIGLILDCHRSFRLMLATLSASLLADTPTAPTGIGLAAPRKAGQHTGLSYLYLRG